MDKLRLWGAILIVTLFTFGVGICVYGIGLISKPVAFITLGVILITLSILINFMIPSKQRGGD
ncbi:hypothetical protein [Staphylococcus borealis]|uniref:hypothetical protein n=1 Tax=Staphylococcus borealis TaxID=2742203 RepID=UPI0039ED6E10